MKSSPSFVLPIIDGFSCENTITDKSCTSLLNSQSMDDKGIEWVESMDVTSGCG